MYIPQAQMPDAANQLNVRITPMAWVVRTRSFLPFVVYRVLAGIAVLAVLASPLR